MRLLAVLPLFMLFACRKEQETLPPPEQPETSAVGNGFPAEKRTRVNGRLFSGLFQPVNGLIQIRYFAAFSDPPVTATSFVPMTLSYENKSLTGNVSVGMLGCNGITLRSSGPPGVGYTGTGIVPLFGSSDSTFWQLVEGNGTFMPEIIALNRRPPQISPSIATYTVNRKKDLLINVRDLITGYDSAFVTIFPYGKRIWRLGADDTLVTMRAGLIDSAAKIAGSPAVFAEGVRYYHKFSNGRLYYFWQSGACERSVKVLPPEDEDR